MIKKFLSRFLPVPARTFHNINGKYTSDVSEIKSILNEVKKTAGEISKATSEINKKIIDKQNPSREVLIYDKKNEPLTENEKYLHGRQNLFYYRYIDAMLFVLTQKSESIIDIGSAGTSVLEPLTWIPKKHSLDKVNPYSSNTVVGIKEDFYNFSPSGKYSFATCFQVLEHVPDPHLFCKKMFEIADNVLISVPFEWSKGHTKSHINDPVSHKNLLEWTGREPTYFIIVDEILVNNSKRCILYYHNDADNSFSLSKTRKYFRENYRF